MPLHNVLDHLDMNRSFDDVASEMRMSDAELMHRHGLFKSNGKPMSLNAENHDYDFNLDSFNTNT